MRNYYFFEPNPNRLNRAWLRRCALDNRSSGGHVLAGPHKRVFPRSQVLRHYIVLSQQHAIQKYTTRRFDKDELASGFHANRLALTADMLELPPPSAPLLQYDVGPDVPLSRRFPTGLHYWHWEKI
jgi:hypothetical protein